MASLWGLGGLTWKDLGRRVWAEMEEDEVFGRAAQLSYYFLLALFPLLLFLISLIGSFAGEDSELRASLFRYLSAVVPGEALDLVSTTVTDVTKGSGGGKLSFGILAALWAASNGLGAISEALNIAYDVKEERPWWKSRLVAIGLTVALAVLIIAALVLILYGHNIAETVAGKFGLGEVFEVSWKVLQWPVILAFVLLAFALIYYFAPDLKEHAWTFVTPGSLIGVVLWLVVSFAFRTYLYFFNSYSATYGSLGAVIILMLWFYLTGAAILIGGEVNSEIEHALALSGEPDAKEKGEKSPGDKEAKGLKPASQTKAERKTSTAERKTSTPDRAQSNNAAAPTPQKNDRATARASVTQSSVTQPKARRGAGESMSIGKVAVVFGAWAVSKIWRRPSKRS
jgi:membrane protein